MGGGGAGQPTGGPADAGPGYPAEHSGRPAVTSSTFMASTRTERSTSAEDCRPVGFRAAAVASGSGADTAGPNLEKLMMRVAAEHARKQLDLPFDSALWYQLTDFECQISAVVNRLNAFSDPKSVKLSQLTAAQVAVNALLRFMIDRGLSPNAITDGEPRSIGN